MKLYEMQHGFIYEIIATSGATLRKGDHLRVEFIGEDTPVFCCTEAHGGFLLSDLSEKEIESTEVSSVAKLVYDRWYKVKEVQPL